ncbi:kinase-like protein [Dichomitus squalens]|uniref:non-specific serine/threonine protein kinase n=1 Tax=Dichomitus squalens TaxID=114155 RepID=A0A4Q9MS63_9APHY|nr:kinase-like protein [Dichomitus squalens]
MLKLLSPLRPIALSWRSTPSISHRAASNWSVTVGLPATPEPTECYKPGGYHPIRIGEVYNNSYRVVRRLGWGRYSTVWLVQNIRDNGYGAMKVLVGELATQKALAVWDELEIMKTLRDTNPHAPGHSHICHILDNFTYEGPHGKHICLVLEPMGFSVLDIYCGFKAEMPLFLVKRISKQLLRALQYMHDDCGIVHTDLKPDNILTIGLPPESGQKKEMTQSELSRLMFKLTDFGAANKVSKPGPQLIQPEKLRAPEVIIGAPWDTKADIWNLGCLVYELATGDVLFNPHTSKRHKDMDHAAAHLAQIEGLLGQFPIRFLEQGRFAGHYFSNEGRLLHGSGLFRSSILDHLQRLRYLQDDLNTTADFLARTLAIDPQRRWSATRLLEHEWLHGVD